MEYGLIGEKLSHSFSKEIHEKLAGYSYELCPLAPAELPDFLGERRFKGVNVTIPYKQAVIPFLDHIDTRAQQIGAVNAIANRGGLLFGTNTDYDGLKDLLLQNGIDPKGKTAMILGSGGAAKTARAVLAELSAGEVLVVSRNSRDGTISYHEAGHYQNTQIIINASPVGMFPHVEEQGINLAHFPQLLAAVDLIYNPLRTRFLQQAEEQGAKAVNGLLMLVSQAKAAASFFTGRQFGAEEAMKLTEELTLQKQNLVLTGMPGSGKTAIGKQLAKRLNRRFVDTDTLIEEREGMSIPQIFERFTEAGFREREAAAVREISVENGIVLATGGGAPMSAENVRNLRLNGKIFFLDRPLEQLAVGGGRPLSATFADTRCLYEKRYLTYRRTCDYLIPNEGEEAAAVEEILRLFEKN